VLASLAYPELGTAQPQLAVYKNINHLFKRFQKCILIC
jgi:hypothetical protein